MSDSRTKAAIPASRNFNPASQLPGNRSFVLPSQAHETNASPEPGQFQKLDAGVIDALGIQAQLAIGAPGDKYEQEADAVAAQVVEQINSPQAQQKAIQRQEPPEDDNELMIKPLRQSIQRQEVPEEEDELMMKPLGQSIQRQEMPEEEEELQMKPLAESIQRQEMPEEEEELQMKPSVQRQADSGGIASTELESSINGARGNGQPLSAGVRGSMEQAFDADFSKVNIHTGSKAHQLNESIQARAFTTGQDIFFRQGEYQPDSRGGQELLAHELTHVVQQNNSRLNIQAQKGSNQSKRNLSYDDRESVDSLSANQRLQSSGHHYSLGTSQTLIQRDDSFDWGALVGSSSDLTAADMTETDWHSIGVLMSPVLTLPEPPVAVDLALPDAVPSPPSGTFQRPGALPVPSEAATCPSGNCHQEPTQLEQFDWGEFEEMQLVADRENAWSDIKASTANVQTGWNELVPLIEAYQNAQDDDTLQTPEMGIQAFEGEESGDLSTLIEQQEVPRTGTSRDTTLGSLFDSERNTELDLNRQDDAAINRAVDSERVEADVAKADAADARVETAIAGVRTQVAAVEQALKAVAKAEANLKLQEATNTQEDAQRDYSDAVSARASAKSNVQDLLKLTKSMVALSGGDASAAWDVAELAAARIVDESYRAQISRKKSALDRAIRRVQRARITYGALALEQAHLGVETAMKALDEARENVRAPLISRRAAYNRLARIASRSSGGSPQTRNRIAGAIAAIPPTEVIVQRISAIESAASSAASRVTYTRFSGIGYTMAEHSGHQQVLSRFTTHHGLILATQIQMNGAKQHWEERLQSLRSVVTRLRGLESD